MWRMDAFDSAQACENGPREAGVSMMETKWAPLSRTSTTADVSPPPNMFPTPPTKVKRDGRQAARKPKNPECVSALFPAFGAMKLKVCATGRPETRSSSRISTGSWVSSRRISLPQNQIKNLGYSPTELFHFAFIFTRKQILVAYPRSNPKQAK